jgi:hypothetical protein
MDKDTKEPLPFTSVGEKRADWALSSKRTTSSLCGPTKIPTTPHRAWYTRWAVLVWGMA